MKIQKWLVAAILSGIFSTTLLAAGEKLDAARIDELTGLKGKMNEKEGVYKVTLPRNDVTASVAGWEMPPFMGLGTWAAFQGTNDKAMMMGDTVLFEDEVNPVMSAALDNGLTVTALHNHFFFDEPKVYFMHIGGEGGIQQLATGVRAALDKVKEIRAANPQPAKSFGGLIPSDNSITAKPLEDLFGVKGQSNHGMFKAVFGRQSKMECGCDLGKEMGV